MQKIEYPLTEIFIGISPYEVNSKNKPMLLEAHNIEPTKNGDYKLHSLITDLNTDGFDWRNN